MKSLWTMHESTKQRNYKANVNSNLNEMVQLID